MKKKIQISILLFFICAVFGLVTPREASAASYKNIGVSDFHSPASRTVGGFTFFRSNSGRLTASKGGNIYTLAKANAGYTVLTDGKTVFFTVKRNVYRANVNGSKKKKLFKHTGEFISFSGVYGNRLFYVTDIDPGTFYSYNTKNNNRKKLAKNVTTANQHGRYFYLTPYEGSISPDYSLRVYDAKTGKLTLISKGTYGYKILNGKVYYSEYVKFSYNYKHTLRIKRCNLNGKGKKTLVKSLKASSILNYGTKSVKYTNHSGKTKTVRY